MIKYEKKVKNPLLEPSPARTDDLEADTVNLLAFLKEMDQYSQVEAEALQEFIKKNSLTKVSIFSGLWSCLMLSQVLDSSNLKESVGNLAHVGRIKDCEIYVDLSDGF